MLDFDDDINLFRQEDALERLRTNCDSERYPNSSGVKIIDDLRHFLETKLNVTILEKGIYDIEYFLCSTYIAEFLSRPKTIFNPKWYPIDQELRLAEKNGGPYLYEEGGKKCFIVAVFFPGIHPKTGFSTKHYVDMSANFFYHFYASSGLEIGNHMAELCEEMVGMTKVAIKP